MTYSELVALTRERFIERTNGDFLLWSEEEQSEAVRSVVEGILIG